jgi:hypothetical protein
MKEETMKTLMYLFLFLISLCLLAGSTHAASIKLTSPNGGENWTIGSTHNITWTITPSSSVKLEVLKGNQVLTIATISQNQTTYPWEVGKVGGHTAGTDYKIKVTNLNTGESDASDAFFTISNITIQPIMIKTWNNLSGLCYIVNCQGTTTITAPILKTVEGLVTPGGTLVLKGQGFGNNPGKVYMSPNASGDYIISNMELPTGGWWNDNAILAVVPSKTGVKEQSVTIKVETADHKVSNIVFATFKPELDLTVLPSSALLNTTCCGFDDGGSNNCDPTGTSFYLFHQNCGYSDVSGYDTWTGHLKNSWVADGKIYDWDTSGSGSANTFYSKFSAGSTDLYIQANFSIDWTVAGCNSFVAVGNIGIIGPKNVPFH